MTTALEDLDGDPAVVQDEDLPQTPVVHRADRLVLDDTLGVRQDFVDALARHYGATSETTDLGSEAGKVVLDSWVEEHTGGLIPRSAIEPDPNLLMVLQDAIVLAARWQYPFYATLTAPEPFTLPTGDVVDLDMMNTGRERDMIYADQLQTKLDADQARLVIFRMPIVDAESKLDLGPLLSERAPSALSGGFGGITDEDLAIGQAAQQAVLAIDEEGTIAAAVTEIGFSDSGSAEPPLTLTIDRPYLVHIADSTTGWPLFLDHIADPRNTKN